MNLQLLKHRDALSEVSPEAPAALTTGSRRLLIAALTAICLFPVWIGNYFPSQNGPEYLLLVKMFREWGNPAYDYSEYYRLVFIVVPNLLAPALTCALSWLMPLLPAAKVTLSLTIVLFPLSVFYLLQQVQHRNLDLGFFSFLYIFNFFVLKGYENYFLSISLLAFYYGYLVKHQQALRSRHVIVLHLLMLGVYFSHMFSFLVALVIVPCHVLLVRDRCPRPWVVLGTLAIPTALFVQFMVVVKSMSDSLVTGHASWIRYDAFDWAAKLYLMMGMHSVSNAAVVLFSIVMLPIYLAALVAAVNFWRRREPFLQKLGASLPLFFAVGFTFAFFIVPRELAGWPKLNERFLPVVFVFLPAAAAIPAGRNIRRGLVALACAGTVGLTAIFATYVLRTQPLMDEYLAGMDHVENNSTLLPIHYEEVVVGRVRPLRWAFNYYNIERGGATGFSVVQYTGRVPMRYRHSMDKVLPRFEREHLTPELLPRIKATYDYVLLWDAPRDDPGRLLLEEHGFEPVHAAGKLVLLKNLAEVARISTLLSLPPLQ